MTLYPIEVGRRFYDSTPITATDPSYNMDESGECVMRGIAAKPGTYRCVAWKGREYYTDRETKKRHSFSRVFVTGIYLDGFEKPRFSLAEEIGFVAVDAGLAGFFQNKPDYDEDAWYDFCDKVNRKNYLILPEGFCTETGYGDGYYPVYKYTNENGEIVGLEIRY